VDLPPIAVDVFDEDVVGWGFDSHAFVFVCYHDLGGVSTVSWGLAGNNDNGRGVQESRLTS